SSLPPLYALRAFESAARTGSFTLAAEELHLTPSAVSKHIKTLEQHFGCRLFQRNGPRIEVTPQGKIFAAELQQGFARIEQACELFRSHRDLLRLKAPSTLTLRWLLDCLSRFRQTAQAFEVQAASVWMDIDNVDFFQRTLRLRHSARQRLFRRQHRRRKTVRRMADPDLRPC
ncbi:LysR family transcriptional regulator, partial [Bacillus cereus group sp. Bc007]|uniref:LysR family transcriptional regulator n=1 Tax=Bacillus cereus group sp. Bc007 TaxID=3018128 RepID=UPI0022E2178F